ncbi:hypothetical protein [Vibrio crassostreae]|uniref:hypothetical protein n=1 Tax=Vibrio crassostreae TaxID=246167 RepID=UPI0010524AB8|nr:hypothetical protein [Vibrio crassostreae]TCW04197.1 hypothetical protein EDB49_11294 [Vibrio crassostreae]CAK1946073.1 hypothetical protein VCRA2113O351_260028 [Vibrio crassostreae]CAK3399725.1 hypothetical protein VCRA2121O127_270083 [Vibrio crassostreae]CAK3412912.1 hypothetical protein VCRA2120E126_280081 [Vibrio crassostreae]
MSSDTLNILTMLGTWFSGLGAFSAVLFALHSNKPRLDIKFGGHFKLDIINKRPVNAHISYVYREISGTPKMFGNFSPYRILLNHSTREDETLDKTIASGEFSVLHLDSDQLYKSYIKQCDYGKIEFPKYMPKMKICVRLTTGKVYKINVPQSFYKDIQQINIYGPEQKLMSLLDPNKINNFRSMPMRLAYSTQTLTRYISAYKADMLWKLPKESRHIKRLRSILEAKRF